MPSLPIPRRGAWTSTPSGIRPASTAGPGAIRSSWGRRPGSGSGRRPATGPISTTRSPIGGRTSAFLYDPAEHLFYRDSTFFARREPNGRKVFWGRGNGWVMAGLARVLEFLPAGHPDRPRFERQFRDMAGAVLACQQPDGLWRSSLLDPADYTLLETSGSGFYCFALAWGVNHGLLPEETYRPAVLRAWAGLTGCVAPDGRLTHVQPIGANPKAFDGNTTEVYGVGAFLLAGSEVYRLVGGTPQPPERVFSQVP